MQRAWVETAIGPIGITAVGESITQLFFVEERFPHTETPLIQEVKKQLLEYFAGERTTLQFPFSETGTMFQKKVWVALRQIPYGETRSYKQIAEMIGQPTASRAVGMANNRNPLVLLTPCHRVIGANGQLVGYAGGLSKKEALLALEAKK